VGRPFSFTAILTSKTDRAHRLPRLLTPELGSLNLRITRPDGYQYVHVPRHSHCGTTWSRAEPYTKVRTPQHILHGPGAEIFSLPGPYIIVGSVPGIPSAKCEIKVIARHKQRLAEISRPLKEHLARGAPSSCTNHTRKLTALLRKEDRERDPLIPTIALLLAEQLSTAADSDKVARANLVRFLELASSRTASPATCVQAVRLRARYCCSGPEEQKRLADQFAEQYRNCLDARAMEHLCRTLCSGRRRKSHARKR
jgi:hypothetical protein